MMDFFRIERHAIERAIEIDKPDVVHAHWTYEFALAAIASKRPHLVTCHDSPVQVLRFMPNLYRLGRYFMARSVFRNAKALSAVSSYLKDEVSRFARVPVMVIPNPVPPILLSGKISSAPRSVDLNQLNIAMILNGWGKRKNPMPALKAFGMLRKRIPGASLHLFGHDFGPGEKAQLWTRSRGMEQGMIFHGSTPHKKLLSILSTMSLLLHPALEESCPMALVEAMALGLPVVGGHESGGVPWVLDYGAAGVLTDVRSPESIFRAMIEILENAGRYVKIVHAGLKRVHEVFGPDVVAQEYEKVYQLILSSSASKLQ